MKSLHHIKLLHSGLIALICFCLQLFFPIYTFGIVQQQSEVSAISENSKTIKKKGLLYQLIEKKLVKKLKKNQNNQTASLNKLSNVGFTFGLISFLGLFVGTFAASPFVLILAALCAIVGDVTSIIVLNRTKHAKEEFAQVRKKAKWGLALSLLTGLLPLLLFAILLLSY